LPFQARVRLTPAVAGKESIVKSDKKKKKEQPGDVLGVSRAGGAKLPHPPSDGSTARGIDVRGDRPRHWGNEDVPQSDGASGVDMGGAGEGTQVSGENPRPKSPAESEERNLGSVSE
jgi:hypothetical protein